MATSPVYIKGNAEGMATSPLYRKANGGGMATSQFPLNGEWWRHALLAVLHNYIAILEYYDISILLYYHCSLYDYTIILLYDYIDEDFVCILVIGWPPLHST